MAKTRPVTKEGRISFRVEGDVRNRLEAQAKKEGVSLTHLMRRYARILSESSQVEVERIIKITDRQAETYVQVSKNRDEWERRVQSALKQIEGLQRQYMELVAMNAEQILEVWPVFQQKFMKAKRAAKRRLEAEAVKN